MTEELKPCPFCGSDDVEALDMEGKHYVACYDCALEGPFHDSRAEAVAAWNRRAAIAAPPGWVQVPVEPTWGMTRAAIPCLNKPEPKVADIDLAYRAMLAAAPQPSA